MTLNTDTHVIFNMSIYVCTLQYLHKIFLEEEINYKERNWMARK